MAMMMSLLGVILLILMLPSLAQQTDRAFPECMLGIADCVDNDDLSCCTDIRGALFADDRTCFCSYKAYDPTLVIDGADLNEMLSVCGIPSFDKLCPADGSTTILSPPPNPSITPPLSPIISPPPSPTPESVVDTKQPSPAFKDTPSGPETRSGSKTMVISVVVASLVVLLGVMGIWLFCVQKRKKSDVENFKNREAIHEEVLPKNPANANVVSSVATRNINDHILTTEALQYEFQTLQASTNNFSDDHMIGRGGFGLVYKGTLANGQDIAVKRLSGNSVQGVKEFKTEVELLAKLRHRNLVSLLGFCLSDGEMLLVYDFVENKSLDNFLFDSCKKEELNWSMRYNIIKGTAKGMLYLHDDSPTRIIHRDLKAANVLLDKDMNPQIADFGLARMSNFEQTHISMSRVAGTYGYMAPEYLMYGKMSVKSDVYSFGALVLEIISGRRINASQNQSGVAENLLSYAWRCWEERTPLEMMDTTIVDYYVEEEVIKCITVGLLSIQEDFTKRPTMARIVHMLDSNSDTALPSIPQRPVFMSGEFGDETLTTLTTSSKSNSAPWSDPNNSK